jgi:AcrR family transcriptional regulator
MTRRLTPRGIQRRDQLIAYAATCFAEQGYHPTSVADIVEGLGVGKGVFYWYFDSKEQLFLEILRDAQRGLRRAQQQAITDVDDPTERIRLGIRATMAWTAEHPEFYKLTRFAATEERFAPALRKGQEMAVADAVRHLREAIDAGQVRDNDPTLMGYAIFGICAEMARTLIHERGEPWQTVADAIETIVLDGIAEPAPTRA